MSLLKATAIFGSFTMISRILGFIRDILMAAVLGAGAITDCFVVAFKLPNFFRRLFAEGAFSASFVPIFSATLEKDGREEAIKFAEEASKYHATPYLFSVWSTCSPFACNAESLAQAQTSIDGDYADVAK
ncbi:MAG: hypothetical protein HN572_11090, partial [Kordiimonadaceae bacterium]|nr:hypothetical protein [Kordiimonadaceae bacterium]